MTVKLPATPRPPGVTDPPADPDKRASVELPPPAPPGSWCGYLAMRAVPFDDRAPFGDGRSGARIAAILAQSLARTAATA